MNMANTLHNKIKKFATSLPFLICLGLVALYLLLAYFAVNPLAKRLVPWIAENKLASHANVDEVRFDPLRLTLTVHNLKLSTKQDQPLASLQRLFVDLEADGMLHLAWHVHDIRLTDPQVKFDVDPKGRLNWSDLIAKLNEEPDQEKSDRIPRVILDHIQIEGGNIRYSERNRPEPFITALAPLALALEGLSTLPEDRGDYQIVAKLPEQGGTLKWKGEVGLNPIVSTGSIELQGVKLAKLMQLIPAAPFKLTAGEADTAFHYNFAMTRPAKAKDAKQEDAKPEVAKAGDAKAEDAKAENEPKPEATIQDFSLSLRQVKGTLQQEGGEFALGETNVHLPALHYSAIQAGDLRWQGLEANIKQMHLDYKGNRLFSLPEGVVHNLDFDLATNQLNIGEIQLSGGGVNARRESDGSLDWQRLFSSPSSAKAEAELAATDTSPASSEAKPFKFNIGHVALENWQATFEDRTYRHPLTVEAKSIQAGLAISNTDDAIILRQFDGELGPVILKSALTPEPAATLAKLKLQQGEISLKDNSVKLAGIVASGLQTRVTRDSNKQLNWLALLETSTTATESKPQAATPGWRVNLDRIALENSNIHIEDKSGKVPVTLDVDEASLELRNGSLDLTQALPVTAHLKFRQGGQFDASGKLALSPLKGDFKLKLEQLSLKPFAPYVNEVALLRLKEGSTNASGRFSFKQEKSFSGNFDGGFSIDNLAVSEEGVDAPFLGWQSVNSDSVKLSLNPDRLHLNELKLVRPVGKIIIYEDRTINIKRIIRDQSSAADKSSASSSTASSPPKGNAAKANTAKTNTAKGSSGKTEATQQEFSVVIERVRVENGDLEFADLSLRPQFGTYINTLNGVINGLSTDPATVAQVELDGKVDEYGSARIRGSIQPFQATEFTDLKLSFRNLDMNKLTPYSGKFAGRKIDSGKMSADLEYKIKNRQLAGTNKFVINKLRLGEHVDSKDAHDLPLDLAIAILEDSNGVIDLDLPISGNLDDPQFSYGQIVWKAITNVIGKIVTAPFRALGNLFGLHSDKLESVIFDAGKAELSPPEREKLKSVAEVVAKKPNLALTVIPSYDPKADKAALQEAAVRHDIAEEMGLQLKPGENPGPVDLNNPKAQSAVQKLAKERSEEGKNRKLVDKLKDYFDTSKPDQAALQAMLQQLRDGVSISDAQLKSLAETRGAAIQGELAKSGLPPEQISISAVEQGSGNAEQVPLKMNLKARK